MNENNNSGVNTILLVVILVAVVAAGVWYLKGTGPQEENDTSIELKLPAGDGNSDPAAPNQ